MMLFPYRLPDLLGVYLNSHSATRALLTTTTRPRFIRRARGMLSPHHHSATDLVEEES